MTNYVLVIDPPQGWMYGFPKPVPTFKTHGDFVKWMLQQGYPKKLIREGNLEHCRYWSEPLPLDFEGTTVEQ